MFNSSIAGIHSGLALMELAAKRIADFENSDIARDTVDMMIAEATVTANIRALETQLAMSKSVIDILA